MVGIEGMGITPVRANNTEQASSRTQKAASTTLSSTDGVLFSTEAEKAAEVVRFTDMASEQQQELRQERIEEAQRKIEESTYKVQSVIQFVAARLTKYVAE